MKREHLFPLDFVRTVAAVMIIVFHYNVVSVMYPEVAKPSLIFLNYANGSMGHIGVSLFFILAGASLMYSSPDKLDLKLYFKKRFLAIYPLYWLVFGAFFTYYYLIKKTLLFERPLWTLLLSVIGMDGYLNYAIPNYYLLGEWFVGCILLIYLLFPLLHRCMLRWPVCTPVAVVAMVVPIVRYYPFQMLQQFFFLLRVPEVLFGMYFIKYIYGTAEQRKRYDWRWGLVSFLGVWSVMTIPTSLPELVKILWTGISYFLFLVWLGQFIKNRVLQKGITLFSTYSFAIYLVHHIMVGKFTFPMAGHQISRLQNYLVFGKYFFVICIMGFIFYHLNQVLIRVVTSVVHGLGRDKKK